MSIKPVTVANYSQGCKYNNCDVSFKAQVALFSKHMDLFVKQTNENPEKIRAMFKKIIEIIKNFKSENIKFIILPKPQKVPTVQITAQMDCGGSAIKYAEKYKDYLQKNMYNKLAIEKDVPMAHTLAEPIEIYKKPYYASTETKIVDVNFDKNVINEIKSLFENNTEAQIFSKMAENRKLSPAERFIKWICT